MLFDLSKLKIGIRGGFLVSNWKSYRNYLINKVLISTLLF